MNILLKVSLFYKNIIKQKQSILCDYVRLKHLIEISFLFFFSYRMFVIFIFCVTRRAKPYLVTHNKNSLDRLLIAGWPLCSGFTYIVVNMVNDTFYPFYCFFSLLLVFFFVFDYFHFWSCFFFIYFVFGSCNWAHVRRMLFKGNNKID